MFGIANGDQGMHFFDQLLLLVIVKVHVPFGKTRFSRSILYENKPNLRTKNNKNLNDVLWKYLLGSCFQSEMKKERKKSGLTIFHTKVRSCIGCATNVASEGFPIRVLRGLSDTGCSEYRNLPDGSESKLMYF